MPDKGLLSGTLAVFVTPPLSLCRAEVALCGFRDRNGVVGSQWSYSYDV